MNKKVLVTIVILAVFATLILNIYELKSDLNACANSHEEILNDYVDLREDIYKIVDERDIAYDYIYYFCNQSEFHEYRNTEMNRTEAEYIEQ